MEQTIDIVRLQMLTIQKASLPCTWTVHNASTAYYQHRIRPALQDRFRCIILVSLVVVHTAVSTPGGLVSLKNECLLCREEIIINLWKSTDLLVQQERGYQYGVFILDIFYHHTLHH